MKRFGRELYYQVGGAVTLTAARKGSDEEVSDVVRGEGVALAPLGPASCGEWGKKAVAGDHGSRVVSNVSSLLILYYPQ